jgi:hypothetical protein
MRARNFFWSTAVLAALLVLLLVPAAVPIIHLGVDGSTVAAGPSLGATSPMILLAAGGDDPPPPKEHDDPPPHG